MENKLKSSVFGVVTQDQEALSVSALNQRIAAVLEEGFTESIWVTAELQEYTRNAEAARSRKYGQVYFELVEKEDGKDQVKAKIKAMMWGEAHEKMLAKVKKASEQLALQDGLQVRILCKINFYWKWGDLRVVVEDIDPDFTLGQMERARRELIKKLQAQGLYDLNRQTILPRPALNLGLITAEASAAYHDFTQELRASGYAFKVYFWRAAMQGEGTEASVVRGIKVLGAMEEVDAVILSRGGGARSDLIWFDKEAIAMAIAKCPKPVLTGIGHEIDQSVADLVAYRHFKTPTALAQFFVEECRSFEMEVAEAALRIVENVREFLTQSTHALNRDAHSLLSQARRAIELSSERLHGTAQGLRSGILQCLRVSASELAGLPSQISRSVIARLKQEQERLNALAQECRLKDPVRLLARGYGLIYQEGRLVKSISGLKVGALLETRLADGRIYSQVKETKKEHRDG